MISLKRFLDKEPSGIQLSALGPQEILPTTIECYRSVLRAIGKSAVKGCPSIGASLECSLNDLEPYISTDSSSELLIDTTEKIEKKLGEWGGQTADHLKSKADEVKQLLLALAHTAQLVGEKNNCYTDNFKGLTSRLETIVDLDDLTQIRSSLVDRLTELKSSVEQMTRESRMLVAQLRAEVTTYENRLKTVEQLILKDELTGVDNRRSIEDRIQFNINNGQTFCVAMIDLNGFKAINDKYGHIAGDDLLRQFARELQINTRSATDVVGRWGGDEFLVLVSSDMAGASLHTNRIRDWVFGKYTLQRGDKSQTVDIYMEASIGLAQWNPGDTLQYLIAQADAAMYRDKQNPRITKRSLASA